MTITKGRLHLELTSKCALACPACARTLFSGAYAIKELSLNVIENILTSSQEFDRILLCGDHGDPIYHTNFHQILRRLKSLTGAPPISICTNGSYRDEGWWTETARILSTDDTVIFGVDGLEKNNHFYRRGASWSSIDLAIQTLRRVSKCHIGWQWILFKYNENDLRLASIQAKKWGIDRFYLVKSFRSISSEYLPTKSILEAKKDFLNG